MEKPLKKISFDNCTIRPSEDAAYIFCNVFKSRLYTLKLVDFLPSINNWLKAYAEVDGSALKQLNVAIKASELQTIDKTSLFKCFKNQGREFCLLFDVKNVTDVMAVEQSLKLLFDGYFNREIKNHAFRKYVCVAFNFKSAEYGPYGKEFKYYYVLRKECVKHAPRVGTPEIPFGFFE
uniref:Uncharacterized protein n=1 Tax=Panagrellus redivivus TaxID=6233 RepID=A0A7E4WA69_PANRE